MRKNTVSAFARSVGACVLFALFAAGCSGERGDVIPLKGNWTYAPGDGQETAADAEKHRYSPLKELRDLDQLMPDRKGTLWLKRDFFMPEGFGKRKLSLVLGNVINVDETYLNGEFIGGYGRAPGNGKSFVNEWNVFRCYDIPSSILMQGRNTLLIKVYSHYEGAVLGLVGITGREYARSLASYYRFFFQYAHLAVFFLLIFVAVYSITIYLRRNPARDHLFYGLACIFFALFESTFFITLVPGYYDLNIPFVLYRKLVFAPVPLLALCLILSINHFLRIQMNEKLKVVTVILCVGAALIVLMLPDRENAVVFEKYAIAVPVAYLVTYLLAVILPRAFRGSFNAKALLAGFIPFMACVVFDIVLHALLMKVEGLYLSGIGFAAFILSINFILANDFVSNQIKVEHLNRDLLSEKERLQVTLASIGDGVIATDTGSTVIMVNDQARGILGRFGKLEEGMSFIRFMDGIDPRHDFRVLFDEMVKSPKKMEFISQTGGGESPVTLAGSIAPIQTREGAKGAVIVLRDITQDIKLQKEIMKMKNLESLGILAGGIAHDFNNILMAIVGNINFAKYLVAENSEVKELLLEAERASLRAKGLTQQLLTFARGGAPVRQVSSIEEVIRESSLFVLRGSSVKVVFNFAPDLENVNVDIGQFSQVIQNVVINAQHAMPDGGVLDVSAENVDEEQGERFPLKTGKYVRISIKDTGQGIPKNVIGKIFEPFFSTKPGGSGLGLATALSVIKNHEGHIAASSDDGRGTEIAIYLPACARKGMRLPESASTLAKSFGRVLIMDDEHDVLLIADRIFRIHGMIPTLVSSSDAAIRSYREAMLSGEPFRMVVLDLTMPGGVGGDEVLRRIMELDPKAVAVISSGYANDPIMAEYKSYGFRGVMVKPYRVEDVSSVIRALRLDA